MKSSKIVVAHVHTNWNFCALLLYISKVKTRRLIVVLENPNISIVKYLQKSIKDLKVEIIVAGSHLGKLLCLSKVRNRSTIKNDTTYVKFTNFSHFGQVLQKFGRFNEVVFIDDGTTFLNILDETIEYTKGWRKILKKLFWPSGFEPRFDCFRGVDVAYINHLGLIKTEVGSFALKCEDFLILFSIQKLKEVVQVYFELDQQVSHWLDLVDSHDTLVLGSCLAEHGFVSFADYEKVLCQVDEKISTKTIYKPHPGETKMSSILSAPNWTYDRLSDVPVEIFFCYGMPKNLISFGSTTSFLFTPNDLNMKNYVFLLENLICDRTFLKLTHQNFVGTKFKRISTNVGKPI